jgi:hypothetical protein
MDSWELLEIELKKIWYKSNDNIRPFRLRSSTKFEEIQIKLVWSNDTGEIFLIEDKGRFEIFKVLKEPKPNWGDGLVYHMDSIYPDVEKLSSFALANRIMRVTAKAIDFK